MTHRRSGGLCWCFKCRWERGRPELDGRPGPEQAVPWFRTCCQDGWLARGWFCRGCGRDEASGRHIAARGIYGCLGCWQMSCLSQCVCGRELPVRNWHYFSCPSCYWVLTRQLVRHLLEQFGQWSHIHERIFSFLIEDWFPRSKGLAEVRKHGLLQCKQAELLRVDGARRGAGEPEREGPAVAQGGGG